jgi:hypothetical protein
MPSARADQVRGLPAPALRAPDRLAVDRDHQPAAGLHGPGREPRAEDPIEHISADQGEDAPEGGLHRQAAGRAQHSQDLRADADGPLPDRGRRPGPLRSPPRPRRPADDGARAACADPGLGQ